MLIAPSHTPHDTWHDADSAVTRHDVRHHTAYACAECKRVHLRFHVRLRRAEHFFHVQPLLIFKRLLPSLTAWLRPPNAHHSRPPYVRCIQLFGEPHPRFADAGV